MAANRQVDVISGCTEDEEFQNTEGQEIMLLQVEKGGDTVSYQLFLAESAPSEFKTEFREFFSGISQSEKAGLIMEAEEEKNNEFLEGLSGNIISCLLYTSRCV